MKIKTIAIDGPAASGKSTLAQKVADKLGYLFFDTGIMYRAVTWLVLDKQVDPQDEDSATRLAEQTEIDVRKATIDDGRSCDVLITGKDITWEIRKPIVEGSVSVIAAYKGVRAALTAQQRKIGLRGNVVMVGRDIGTVVLPEADLKIYLDASPEERARRRHTELIARGEEADYGQILAKVKERDFIDSNREVAPLRAAKDAVVINSSDMSIEQVVETVMKLAQAE